MLNVSGASVVIHKQNKLIKLFNEAGAMDAEHAILIERFGIRRSFIFNRMVLRGVFIECEPDKFYMDNNIVPMFIELRRRRALTAFGIVLLLAVMVFCFSLIKF